MIFPNKNFTSTGSKTKNKCNKRPIPASNTHFLNTKGTKGNKNSLSSFEFIDKTSIKDLAAHVKNEEYNNDIDSHIKLKNNSNSKLSSVKTYIKDTSKFNDLNSISHNLCIFHSNRTKSNISNVSARTLRDKIHNNSVKLSHNMKIKSTNVGINNFKHGDKMNYNIIKKKQAEKLHLNTNLNNANQANISSVNQANISSCKPS